MKEATGEVSMTVIVIVAVAVIGGILAVMWPGIRDTIQGSWGNAGKQNCVNAGGSWKANGEGSSGYHCEMPD